MTLNMADFLKSSIYSLNYFQRNLHSTWVCPFYWYIVWVAESVKIIFLFMFMWCECIPHVCGYVWKPEEWVGGPETEVAGDHERYNFSSENWTFISRIGSGY